MVRPTDEYRRAEHLLATCAACFRCGRPLGPQDPVWLAPAPVRLYGHISRVVPRLPHCLACRDREETPERVRQDAGCPCEACGRMTFEEPDEGAHKRGGRRFCCLRCEDRYYKARAPRRKK